MERDGMSVNITTTEMEVVEAMEVVIEGEVVLGLTLHWRLGLNGKQPFMQQMLQQIIITTILTTMGTRWALITGMMMHLVCQWTWKNSPMDLRR
jgi:hypothetical protein